jgi:Na+/H+-translocating membrane pyrophosphatase
MTIQSIQKMMGPTVLAILTALFDDLIEGLARFGCGMVGLPYPDFEHFDQ